MQKFPVCFNFIGGSFVFIKLAENLQLKYDGIPFLMIIINRYFIMTILFLLLH